MSFAKVTIKKHLRPRTQLLLGAILFSCLFNYAYIAIVSPTWAYTGMTFTAPPNQSILLASLLALLPIIWLPMHLTRPSQLLYWFLYTVVYVPSIFIPHYMQRQGPFDLFLMNFSFFLSFYILGLFYKLPIRSIPRPNLSWDSWWFFVAAAAVIFYIAVMVVYGGRLQFSGLYNIELRLASRELDSNIFSNYGHVWLANVINPTLIAIGLLLKNPLVFFIGVVGQIILFMTAAQKMVLMSVIFVIFLFFILNSKRYTFGLRFILGMSSPLIFMVSLELYESLFSFTVQTLIGLRLFSVAGFMTSVYSDFFSQNPWTFWSHLKGFSTIIEYPYQLPLPFLIGDFIGDVENSANAHAWATDGIAAMGFVGVLIVGLVMGCIFYILDCTANELDPKLSGLSIAAHGAAIGNLSIMSVFLGGGLFFNMILLLLMPRAYFGARHHARSDSFPEVTEGHSGKLEGHEIENRTHR